MASNREKIYPGNFYHIYNRGNNRENIFLEEKNYRYFLDLWGKYIVPIAETYAYCLMKNHFHFLVRIRQSIQTTQASEISETSEAWIFISRQFSNMFNAYAKAINKKYNRTGSLFQTRFRRKRVTSDSYLLNLIHYIHFNPQKHGFVEDFRDYPYSSYHVFLENKKTHVARQAVIDLFGDVYEFIDFHNRGNNYKTIQTLIKEDEDL